MQSKFEVFDKLKPVFEEFHKEYPEDDPVKVIKEVQQRKEEAHNLIKLNNDLSWKLKDLESYYKKELMSKNKEVNSLHDKIREIDQDSKAKLEGYVNEITSLQAELKHLKVHERDNLKLQNYLYHIYNQLIDTFSLNKSIKLDAALKVTEHDFKPDLFENEAIKTYIQAMITSSNTDKKNKLLREVMAYSNMMLRMFAKEKLTSKFDPVTTFKAIKDKLVDYKNQNIELKDKVRILNENMKTKDRENKKSILELQNTKRLYQSLENKFEKQFQDKVDTNRRMSSMIRDGSARMSQAHTGFNSNVNTENMSKTQRFFANVNNICDFYKHEASKAEEVNVNEQELSNEEELEENGNKKLKGSVDTNTNLLNINNENKFEKGDKKPNETHENENNNTNIFDYAKNNNYDNTIKVTNTKNRPFSGIPYQKNIFITKSKDRPLTTRVNNKANNNTKNTIKNNNQTNQIRNIQSARTRPETGFQSGAQSRIQSSVPKNKFFLNPNQKIIKSQQSSKLLIPKIIDVGGVDIDKKINQLGLLHNEFIGLNGEQNIMSNYQMAENRDKLVRTGGNYKILPTHLSGLTKLVEHTNRLFLYKSRMNSSSKVNNLMNERNMFNKFRNYIEKTNSRLKSISKRNQISNRFDSKIEVDDIIIGKIDNLLNKFKVDGV